MPLAMSSARWVDATSTAESARAAPHAPHVGAALVRPLPRDREVPFGAHLETVVSVVGDVGLGLGLEVATEPGCIGLREDDLHEGGADASTLPVGMGGDHGEIPVGFRWGVGGEGSVDRAVALEPPERHLRTVGV